MKELKLTGNCLKGSRPILSFDATFETLPEWKLMKEVLIQALGSPKAHPKAKPFIDHVFSFSVADGKIWFRNYQIVFDADSSASVKTAKKADPVLVEIGPRFVLTPVKILSGSFSGVTLYENEKAVSPAASRASIKRARADEFAKRVLAKGAKKQKVLESELPVNELDDVFAGEFEE
jgi:ribosome biogenesis protein BRX1